MKTLKTILLSAAVVCGLSSADADEAKTTGKDPVSVFIVAGQSNADGRAPIAELPEYLADGYQYLQFNNVTMRSDGKFKRKSFKKNFSFCDVTNHYIEQALQDKFYVVKCALGGTAIAPGQYPRKKRHHPIWYADPEWLKENSAYRRDTIGHSLALSLAVGMKDSHDVTLSKIKRGYDVKAILWHQGESDAKAGASYYDNLKTLINYMRSQVVEATGNDKYRNLPFIFGSVPHSSKLFSRQVEEAQKRIAAEDPNVYMIDLSDAKLQDDRLHFGGAWAEYFGKLAFNQLVDLGLVPGEKLEVSKPQ